MKNVHYKSTIPRSKQRDFRRSMEILVKFLDDQDKEEVGN